MTDTEANVGWVYVADVNDFPSGEVRGVDIGDRLVAVYRLEDGEFFATDDICTHEYARLSDGWLEGDVIECPLHAGQFNVRTGVALCAPAVDRLECFPLRVTDGQVWVKLDASP